MGLLNMFSDEGWQADPSKGMLGLLSPSDRFMAAMQAISHMGAQMAQPGQSRGQALANAGAGLSSGLQSGMQSAITQGLLGQKLQESTDKTKARKMFADVFSEPGSMTPPTPINVAQPGQSTAQAMQQRLNTGNAGAFNDKLQDPRLMQAMALDSSLAPTITALRTANAPIKFNAGEGFMTPNGQIIRQPGGQTDLAKLLSDRDALPAGDPRRDLYDAEIVKRQTEGGFRFGPNGMQPLQGGPADTQYVQKKAFAEASGQAPFKTVPIAPGGSAVAPFMNMLPGYGLPGGQGAPPQAAGAPGSPPRDPRIVYQDPRPAPGTTEGSEAKGYGDSLAKLYEKVTEEGRAASAMHDQIALTRSVQAPTGRLAAGREALGGWLQAFGYKGDLTRDATDLQKFNGIVSNYVLGKQTEQAGVQTEGDAARMKETFANMKNIDEANDYLLRAAQAQTSRKMEKADFFDNYRGDPANKGSVAGAEKAWRDFIRSTPIVANDPASGRQVFFNEFKDAVQRMAPDTPYQEIVSQWQRRTARK